MAERADYAGVRLLADIGGTNARFAILRQGSSHPEHERNLTCAEFRGIEQAVRHYLNEVGAPIVREAAMDVACPVTGDLIHLTNSPWNFSIEQTRRLLGLERLLVVNDFTALALCLPGLELHELRQVGGGQTIPEAPIALIGAGTGLGVSGLIRCGTSWLPIQGEGGHAAFSSMTEREDQVLRHLRERFGHVSNERLVSGPGLANVYEALCALDRVVHRGLTPQQIAETAMKSADARCEEALNMFCAAMGTASADLVLALGALGGLYIGGGIVPKLGDWFEHSPFRKRFEHKGRFSSYLAAIPAYVILAENPALRGLAAALNQSS